MCQGSVRWRVRLEELSGLADRHVEDVADGLAVVLHLECFAIIAFAVAFLAFHIDIRKEVHLDLQGAVTVTGFATAALDIEGEPSGTVAANLRLGSLGEQGADFVPYAGVGRRIRTGVRPIGFWST